MSSKALDKCREDRLHSLPRTTETFSNLEHVSKRDEGQEKVVSSRIYTLLKQNTKAVIDRVTIEVLRRSRRRKVAWLHIVMLAEQVG